MLMLCVRDMKPIFLGSSLHSIKCAVLALSILSLFIHSLFALWTTRHQTSVMEVKTLMPIGGQTITSSSTESLRGVTSAKIHATKPVQDLPKTFRWNSGDSRCAYVEGNRTVLPARYVNVNWPPVQYLDCGVGELLSPWRINGTAKPWMVFIVKSAPQHFIYRSMIRRTWGSVTEFREKPMLVIFLIGLPANKSVAQYWQDALKKENQLFGDVLQCPVPENYHNLPLKVIHSLGWIMKHNLDDSYYTFTDSDCVMSISNIFTYFQHLSKIEADRNIYCGFIYDRNATAMRKPKSKWYVSPEVYEKNKYPSFCHGGMYTMKKTMVKSLFCTAQITNFTGFFLEDVLITGILREKERGSGENAKPVLTRSGKQYDLMYYPWIDDRKAILYRMKFRWKLWSIPLQQFRMRKLIKIRDVSNAKSEVSQLINFWQKYVN